MCKMDKETADRFGIEDHRNYVVLDIPKSNYSAPLQAPLYFKRGVSGALEHIDPHGTRIKEMSAFLLELLQNDSKRYTKRELVDRAPGKDIAPRHEREFPHFCQIQRYGVSFGPSGERKKLNKRGSKSGQECQGNFGFLRCRFDDG